MIRKGFATRYMDFGDEMFIFSAVFIQHPGAGVPGMGYVGNSVAEFDKGGVFRFPNALIIPVVRPFPPGFAFLIGERIREFGDGVIGFLFDVIIGLTRILNNVMHPTARQHVFPLAFLHQMNEIQGGFIDHIQVEIIIQTIVFMVGCPVFINRVLFCFV